MMASIRLPVAGLSKLATALAGGGNSAYQDAFSKEAELQSKIGQALATTRKANAETALTEQAVAARSPEAILTNALTTFGVPSDARADVEEFQRTGRIASQEPLADDLQGPVLPRPEWYGRLGNLGRAIGATQSAIALGDTSVKNLADATGKFNDEDIRGRVLTGSLSPLAVAQAQYALKGSAPFDFNEYGVGNNLTGELDTANPAAARFGQVRDSEIGRNRASAVSSYASAENSRASAALNRSKIGQNQTTVLPDGSVISSGPAKPLPPAALKMQQDDLEGIGLANAIEADLGAVSDQIAGGQLKLGPLKNVVSQGANAVGASTQNSRNFASFRATLEKLRNDSLRLNKGVQTEGDAQRAWNEILANINDTSLVQQRLAEVRAINRRAAELRQNNLNVLRQNFGAPPLDMRVYQTLQPSLGNRGSAPAQGGTSSGWSITKE